METPPPDKVRQLFERALDVPPADREAFVRREAASAEQAEAVLRLLANVDANTDDLRPRPAMDTEEPKANDGERVQSTATGELLKKLATAPKLDEQRFVLSGEVGKGGMGAVMKVHDAFLNRRLAMKVLLERAEPRDEEERRLQSQLLGRFLEEAQVTSQLDHPGVVPVHELGIDQNGKVYFTMRLVKGRTASEVFADAFHERDGWNLTRALEVILKVCDTMAYAHDKGVLHRDLKPSNVMVGRFGEVYVVDWGLAKVVGQEDRHDLRIQKDASTGVSHIESSRRRDAETDTASSVVTMDGHALGTPSYMPPEQARSEELDVRADVYAIGAMLYELVCGRVPYTAPGVQASPYRLLQEVVDGPPKRVEDVHKGVPSELVAIIDKAMARERDGRYVDVVELAGDVRAFVAGRVVKAYRTGALVELRLWVRRNRLLAAAMLAIGLSLAAGIVATKLQADEADKQRMSADYNLRRFDAVRLRALLDEANTAADSILSGSRSDLVAIERWLIMFSSLGDEETEQAVQAARQTLIDVDAGDRLVTEDGTEVYMSEIVDQMARQAAKYSATSDGRELRMKVKSPDPTPVFLQRMVEEVGEEVTAFGRPDGLLARIRSARERALAIRKMTLAHPNARYTWEEARAAIRKADGVVASKLYAGQAILLDDENIWGLVPIGMNPQSQLWEFYDLYSAWDGESDPAELPIPMHNEGGEIDVSADTGLVFVLLPGGVPAQFFEKRTAEDGTSTTHLYALRPFFVSKFEMTTGQWQRLARVEFAQQVDARLPISNISWHEANTVTTDYGLSLPSRMQWVFALTGETPSRSGWPGSAPQGDASTAQPTGTGKLAPVGQGAPNVIGLFDTEGNASEWCVDWHGQENKDYALQRGDGRASPPPFEDKPRLVLGASAGMSKQLPPTAYRTSPPADSSNLIGLRPIRMLTRMD